MRRSSGLIAALIFVLTYVALSVGRIPGLRSDRLAASVIGAVLVVVLRVLTLEQAQAAIDGATLGLLFGMMILSAALELSGTFALAGWWITRRAQTPLGLLVTISVTSAVLSAFLINDVVCIAFTPLVLQIAERLERDPKPYLLSLALSSNIGSVATITGNPQNILIGSLSGISYGRFAMALAPVALFSLALGIGTVWCLYRAQLSGRFVHADAPRPRTYQRWLWKSALVTGCVLSAFVVGVPPVFAALLGGSAMLLTRAVKPKRVYGRIDWTLLALFSGLFVVVAAVEVVVERSKSRCRITFLDFLKVGLPTGISSLAFGALWLWLIR